MSILFMVRIGITFDWHVMLEKQVAGNDGETIVCMYVSFFQSALVPGAY